MVSNVIIMFITYMGKSYEYHAIKQFYKLLHCLNTVYKVFKTSRGASFAIEWLFRDNISGMVRNQTYGITLPMTLVLILNFYLSTHRVARVPNHLHLRTQNLVLIDIATEWMLLQSIPGHQVSSWVD